MTKQKLHETVLALCVEHKAKPALVAALTELTIPKIGGGSDVNDYTVFDGEAVAYVFCTYHKMWEPVSTVSVDEEGNEVVVDLFKANPKAKNGLTRECLEGLKQWNAQAKQFKATKESVLLDLMEEAITGPKAKDLIAVAEQARATHTAREDGLGFSDKPGAVVEAEDSVEDTEEAVA